jgi:hypothetical protein
MTRPRPPRLPAKMRQALESSRLKWRLENGRRHWKMIIGGRLTAILPKSGRLNRFSGRAELNTMQR